MMAEMRYCELLNFMHSARFICTLYRHGRKTEKQGREDVCDVFRSIMQYFRIFRTRPNSLHSRLFEGLPATFIDFFTYLRVCVPKNGLIHAM